MSTARECRRKETNFSPAKLDCVILCVCTWIKKKKSSVQYALHYLLYYTFSASGIRLMCEMSLSSVYAESGVLVMILV